MVKRLLLVAATVIVGMAITAVPAFAGGYNTPGAYTPATGYFAGPHGGYATTTNKCADCHSTHYASGSFQLLRASSREAACDYCHGGGGGSNTNIMMDNAYKTNGSSDMSTGVAEVDGGSGLGTGHTLGYTGNAPADIKPAYTDAEGFSCFDCHSPHGNSARILTTFSDPGRAMGTGAAVLVSGSSPSALGNSDGTISQAGEWGIDATYGNLKWWDSTAGKATAKPIWPSGRFLLLKNPHTTAAEGQEDTVVTTGSETADNGVNKLAVNWTDPLGPADGTYGGGQDNDNDKTYPFAPGGANGGFLAESEFCTDCHDGVAGASTQPANVWQPAGTSGSEEGTYAVAYSHNAQPRH